MKDIKLLLIILFSTSHFAICQNATYSIQEPLGYCYDVYSYSGQEYPVCYRGTAMQKSQFHFGSANRRFVILYARRYSAKGFDNRTILYDTYNNSVSEIDSCKRNPSDGLLRFLGADGDTLYISTNNGASVDNINPLPITIADATSDILRKLSSIPNVDTWCIPNSKDKLAYSEMNSLKLSLICRLDTAPRVIGNGEVIAWKDDNHLLYTEITVEGGGDYYSNLCEYSVVENRSKLIAKHLDNIFDYNNGILAFERAPRIVCLAKLDNEILTDLVELDFRDAFNNIYTLYMLNSTELIIGGDRPNFDSFYYKCKIDANGRTGEK